MEMTAEDRADAEAMLSCIAEDRPPDVAACRAFIRACGRMAARETFGGYGAMQVALAQETKAR